MNDARKIVHRNSLRGRKAQPGTVTLLPHVSRALYLLGAFAKWRKATTSFVMSDCPSVRLLDRPSVSMEQFGYNWMDFHEIWYLRILLEHLSRKGKFNSKSDKNNGNFTWRPIHVVFIVFSSILPNTWNVSDKSFRQNQKHMLCSIIFYFFFIFLKSCRLWDNGGEKQTRAREVTRLWNYLRAT